MSGTEDAGRPALRVVRGAPTDEELAALVSVLAARAAAAREAARDADRRSAPRSDWADRARRMRRPLPHGPGAWRAGGQPR